jgi:hypothetical protein
LEQEKNAIFLARLEQDPTNPQVQMGREMSPKELERRLKKLNPNLQFAINSHNTTKKYVFCDHNGTKETLCPYENSTMPERSVLKKKAQEVQDMSVSKIERKDLPRATFVPGQGFVFDSLLPGFKVIQQPWGEAVRGWRTVLIKLVKMGYLTPAQVEREFGSDNTAQWASHLGKQRIAVAW